MRLMAKDKSTPSKSAPNTEKAPMHAHKPTLPHKETEEVDASNNKYSDDQRCVGSPVLPGYWFQPHYNQSIAVEVAVGSRSHGTNNPIGDTNLLAILGIGVDRQLELLASHREDETSEDPFDLKADELPANPGHVTSDEDVRATAEVLIEQAVAHGFPPDKVDKLRVIMHIYGLWRLELGDDPPAPPARSTFEGGGSPMEM
ncbi:unnamed protein product [Phytophthora fragariaefolia]|uniref:Unnamed protein product n=1 Tax=Phytophthora fragariaefolia TaxID=1490495 RepID=A0A9W6XQ77_9STRA|nr:unnamed protein product [Phytophthora fragariaefolia]